MTWQEAKAHTQAMELQIVALIPEDAIEAVNQMPKGTLLSCSGGGYTWNGGTEVRLKEGESATPMVRAIEAHFRGLDLPVRVDESILGKYRIQIVPRAKGESYIVREVQAENILKISSGSPCFTLPEGESSMGEF